MPLVRITIDRPRRMYETIELSQEGLQLLTDCIEVGYEGVTEGEGEVEEVGRMLHLLKEAL